MTEITTATAKLETPETQGPKPPESVYHELSRAVFNVVSRSDPDETGFFTRQVGGSELEAVLGGLPERYRDNLQSRLGSDGAVVAEFRVNPGVVTGDGYATDEWTRPDLRVAVNSLVSGVFWRLEIAKPGTERLSGNDRDQKPCLEPANIV